MTQTQAMIVSLLAVTVCLGSLGVGYRHVTGTTLRACWMWCLATLAVLAMASLAALGPLELGDAIDSHIRHAAGITTFCPLMALLGAKRPQDRAWQFIVLSLWIILMLPSAVGLLRRPEAVLSLHGARQWFLAILVAVGVFNGIATRFWLACLLAAAAQVLLLAPFLPWLDGYADRGILAETMAYGLATASLAAACVLRAADWPRRAHAADPLDQLWLDFRDHYGAVWGLRIAERTTTAAGLVGWPVRLGWNGFAPADPADATPLTPETRHAVEKSLRTVLRRFVSSDWISERLNNVRRNEKASA